MKYEGMNIEAEGIAGNISHVNSAILEMDLGLYVNHNHTMAPQFLVKWVENCSLRVFKRSWNF